MLLKGLIRLKRTIHEPEGFKQEQMQGFSLLPSSASAIAITNRLTGSQFRLWHYLMAIDPFADQTSSGKRIYHSIPSPAEIGVAIGSSTRTVEKDMKRIEELGLYTKRVVEWQGYNLTAEQGKQASRAMKKALAERRAQAPNLRVKPPEPLQEKGGYLAANSAILPGLRLNNRSLSEIAADKIAVTHIEQEFQPPAILPQTIQTIQILTDNCVVVDEKFEEEEEVAQGPDISEVSQVLLEPVFQGPSNEPTGILEEPLSDPIAQAQQSTAQLLDERQNFDRLRRLGVEINETVRAVMKKFKANVSDAIAHIQQRYNNRERFHNITGAFVKACQEGSRRQLSTLIQVNPPTAEQMCQLQQAKASRTLRDFYLAPPGNNEQSFVVDTGFETVPWWKFFERNQTTLGA